MINVSSGYSGNGIKISSIADSDVSSQKVRGGYYLIGCAELARRIDPMQLLMRLVPLHILCMIECTELLKYYGLFIFVAWDKIALFFTSNRNPE